MEEVEDGVGEGGWKLQTGAPLSKHLGPCNRQPLWGLLFLGTSLEILSPGRLSISMVAVTKSLTVNPWSSSWVSVHLGHYL